MGVVEECRGQEKPLKGDVLRRRLTDPNKAAQDLRLLKPEDVTMGSY
jgi:hypothetical protein